MTPSPTKLVALVAVVAAAAVAGLHCSKSAPDDTKAAGGEARPVTLLNVSYDPTRELYEDFNAAFAKHWLEKKHQAVTVKQSHGGSGKQARAVIDGLDADIVSLGLAYDVDEVAAKGKLLPEAWQARLPNNSAPYTSTIVFLVRKGNPKGIKDWGDLVKPDTAVITASPKTSGGARWNYLAGWGWALGRPGGDETSAKEYVTRLYKNVPVLDSGARGSTITFVKNGIGDVLLTWENEAYLAIEEMGKDKVEVVNPPFSILAEPSVALVDKNVDKHGTREVAQAYLEYLYTPEGQEIAAKHYYRPRNPEVAAKYAAKFQQIKMITVEDLGGWKTVQAKHFADGGIFDAIYKPTAKR
jgi:sulfate/thiosulfate transport system substrate-binding protein